MQSVKQKQIYYGAMRPLKKDERRPTMTEAVDHGRISYFGLKQIDTRLINDRLNKSKGQAKLKKDYEKAVVEWSALNGKRHKLQKEYDKEMLLNEDKRNQDFISQNRKEYEELSQKVKDKFNEMNRLKRLVDGKPEPVKVEPKPEPVKDEPVKEVLKIDNKPVVNSVQDKQVLEQAKDSIVDKVTKQRKRINETNQKYGEMVKKQVALKRQRKDEEEKAKKREHNKLIKQMRKEEREEADKDYNDFVDSLRIPNMKKKLDKAKEKAVINYDTDIKYSYLKDDIRKLGENIDKNKVMPEILKEYEKMIEAYKKRNYNKEKAHFMANQRLIKKFNYNVDTKKGMRILNKIYKN